MAHMVNNIHLWATSWIPEFIWGHISATDTNIKIDCHTSDGPCSTWSVLHTCSLSLNLADSPTW